MLEISSINKRTLNRVIDKLKQNYIETGQDPRNEMYTHGPTIVLLEGLVAAGQYVIELGSRFERWLEKPRDPLTAEQVEALQDLESRIEGLKVSGDYNSVKNQTPPTIMYADYRGEFLGTAYGSKFAVFAQIKGDLRKQEVVAEIMRAYLPDSDEKQ